MPKKTINIEANNFSDIESFYDKIDRVLTHGLNWKTGHNLNAFNDLLCGGFGVYEYDEPIKLVWNNFEKSKNDLKALLDGEPIYKILVDMIKTHEHIEFIQN